MPGAEYVTRALLEKIWRDLDVALGSELLAYRGDVQAYLADRNSVWNVVGRVHFHLAENKRNAEAPFAFLATYTHRISEAARVAHLPLGQALKEYAGAASRQKLLALLTPIQKAASQSGFLKKRIDSGEIFH